MKSPPLRIGMTIYIGRDAHCAKRRFGIGSVLIFHTPDSLGNILKDKHEPP